MKARLSRREKKRLKKSYLKIIGEIAAQKIEEAHGVRLSEKGKRRGVRALMRRSSWSIAYVRASGEVVLWFGVPRWP